MDLKASDRVPCKSCGKNGDNMRDHFKPGPEIYYVYCKPCLDKGDNGYAHTMGNNRPETVKKWNAMNDKAEDETAKTTLDTSKMKDKELAKKVKALLESNDEEISTTTLNNCPVCNGKTKLVPMPFTNDDGNIDIHVVVVPQDSKCANHFLIVGDNSHENSKGKKWSFRSPESAIYAFNKLYPRPMTDEMFKEAKLVKDRNPVYNTRPEDKTCSQYTWDDLNLPEDTEIRYIAADDWTRVSISPDTLPVA